MTRGFMPSRKRLWRRQLNWDVDATAIYQARGATFPHRERLRHWGWRWDRFEARWEHRGHWTPSAPPIQFAAGLPGVYVHRVDEVTGDVIEVKLLVPREAHGVKSE